MFPRSQTHTAMWNGCLPSAMLVIMSYSRADQAMQVAESSPKRLAVSISNTKYKHLDALARQPCPSQRKSSSPGPSKGCSSPEERHPHTVTNTKTKSIWHLNHRTLLHRLTPVGAQQSQDDRSKTSNFFGDGSVDNRWLDIIRTRGDSLTPQLRSSARGIRCGG